MHRIYRTVAARHNTMKLHALPQSKFRETHIWPCEVEQKSSTPEARMKPKCLATNDQKNPHLLDNVSTDLTAMLRNKLCLQSEEDTIDKQMLLLQSLEPGDMIEFKREKSSDWAVFIGDKAVVHLICDEASDKASSSNVNSSSRIEVDDFFKVAGRSIVERNNNSDTKSTDTLSFTRKEFLVRVAVSLCKDLKFNDSKHFATWCRYGDDTNSADRLLEKNYHGSFNEALHVIKNAFLLVWHA
ncbi:uncharacterized protein LOC112562227 isoform X2 [Pomacea canaliculata]|nr:uncharacterized protein LOC112562227 isoform X2 [Pomacea canaliculata]XP_025091116.1 uncharacterized protein LOC112562227 isoform X2 [Pomacea canaliculata]